MTVNEAKQIVRDDALQFGCWIEATIILTDRQNADSVTFEDLLVCLKRGAFCAEAAAAALYERTQGPRPGYDAKDPYHNFSTAVDDWIAYLRAHKHL